MGPLDATPRMIGHFAVSFCWLGFLAFINQQASQPVLSVFPYLVPVVFFSCTYSARWGFLMAGIATLSAIPGHYIDTHTTENLLYAGFSTYAQLTGAAVGAALAKRAHLQSGRS